MKRYRVWFETVASTVIEVEAEDEQDAVDAAYDGVPGICAKCNGWGQRAGIELGEWELATEGTQWGKEAPWAIEELEDES